MLSLIDCLWFIWLFFDKIKLNEKEQKLKKIKIQKEVKIKSSKLNKYFDELDITPSKNTNNTAKNDLNTRPITIPEDTPNKLREVFSKEALDFIRNDKPNLKYKNGKKHPKIRFFAFFSQGLIGVRKV